MSDTARDLVDQMVEAGDWPDPALLEAIVERGDEAVGPLVEIIRQDPEDDDWSGESPVFLAVGLLRDLHARSAIPELLEQFHQYDDELVEELADTLGSFGPEVIEPVLAIARDRTLDSYPRVSAIEAAKRAAGNDPALRARIVEVVRELLADCIAHAEDATEDDMSLASDLVVALTDLADPQADDLIHAAYQADLIDKFYLGEEEDLKSSREEEGPWYPRELPAFLQLYRERYEEHQAYEQRSRERATLPPPVYRPLDESDLPPPPPPVTEPIRHTERKPGRNDPCWCGSGKKYKKCHLSQDQA